MKTRIKKKERTESGLKGFLQVFFIYISVMKKCKNNKKICQCDS